MNNYETVMLDDSTSYYMKDGNIIIEIRNIRESDDSNIKIEKYTIENLIAFYTNKLSNNLEFVKINEKSSIIIDWTNKLIFIPLFNRYKNLVDYTYLELEIENLEKLQQYSFCRWKSRDREKKYVFVPKTGSSMHELIFGKKANEGNVIDHINSNGLDNRRSNLREISFSYNIANREMKKDGYRGVFLDKKTGKWKVKIEIDRIEIRLGCFDDPIEAAKIYDIYSLHYRGDIVPLNKHNGKNILTDEEIYDVFENGIPEKYQRKESVREFPKNIGKNFDKFHYKMKYLRYFRDKNACDSYLTILTSKGFGYRLNDMISKKQEVFCVDILFWKSFETLEEAQKELERLKQCLFEIDENEKKKLETTIDSHRNEAGIALLPVMKSDKYTEIEIDDEDWKKCIHHKWVFAQKYPFNNELGFLHIHIFKTHNELAYKNKKSDETIDHIDMNPNNVRKNNLRLANRTQQGQNRKLTRKSHIPYTGVTVSYGKFNVSLTWMGKKEVINGFIYMEDAARKYNEIVLKYDKNARINIVTDTKTTAYDIYHKSKINSDFVKDIWTIGEIAEIARANPDWKKKHKISIDAMKVKDLDLYKELFIKLIMEERKN